MKYLLGSGRYKVEPEFEEIWNANSAKADILPEQTVILAVGETGANIGPGRISLRGNLGHVGDLLNGTKPYAFCGWSAAFIQLAMTAYCAELDFIYKEQDCLAFGPWVSRMYRDMGDGGMVFGGKMATSPYMPCAQSLVLVRHSFIPWMVCEYLSLGTDNDVNNLPEHKFAAMAKECPGFVKFLSFGYDRCRPINWDDEVFYAQKFSVGELSELRRRQMI